MRTDPVPGTSKGVVVFSSPLGTTNVTGVPSFRTPSTEFTTRRSCVYSPAGARSRARRRVRFARATKWMVGEDRGRWIQPLSFPASARWTWMSENTTFNCLQSAGASRTYTYSVPDVTEPRNANPAMRSKPVTAMANTVRGLIGSSSATIIRGEGYIDSRNFPRSITRALRPSEWSDRPDRSVDSVDRFASCLLVVRLHEDLAALVQREFRLAFEDEHHLHVADAPAAAPQPFRGPGRVHPPRLPQAPEDTGREARAL